MQGASPLASPGAEPGRHWNREANHAPDGGLVSGVGGSTCRCGTRRGVCFPCRFPPPPPLVLILPPIPPAPFPSGEGGDYWFSYARGFAPCIPGAGWGAALTGFAMLAPRAREPAVQSKTGRTPFLGAMPAAKERGDRGRGTSAFEMVLSPGAGDSQCRREERSASAGGGISFPSGHHRHPPHRAFRAIPRISRPRLGQ